MTQNVVEIVAVAVAVAGAFAAAVAGAAVFILIGGEGGGTVALVYGVFFLMLPALNALMDFLSWGATRALLAKFHSDGPGSRSPLWIGGAIVFDLVIAVACLAGLCALMALTLEMLNQLFLWRGMPVIDWRSQVALAIDYPLSKGILVTGMLVTTLIPTMIHIAVGLEHAFTAPTPDTRAAAALIHDGMSTGEKQRVADVMVARDWYLYPCFAFAAVLVLAIAALIGLGAAPLGLTLADIAYCSASLIDGPCAWTDGVSGQ